MNSPTPAIELHRVSRLFGSFAALRDVSFAVETGATVLLLGENGAGKSTLLRLVAGLGSPSFGSVSIFGQTPIDARDRVAYLGHATMLYDELTATENLEYTAALYGIEADSAQALQAVGLDPANPRRVGEYSQGMRQRTAMARVLLTAPDLLLLDEPFSNLDVASVGRMIARLQAYLAQPGRDGIARTLVLTTHQRELAAPLHPRAITLSGGKLLEEAPNGLQ